MNKLRHLRNPKTWTLWLLTFGAGAMTDGGVLAGAQASDLALADLAASSRRPIEVPEQASAWIAPGPSIDGSVGDQRGNFKCPTDSGCTCIEWCNAPVDVSELGIDWGVVCRVVRGCNKYSRAVKADCVADLESVQCAHNRPAVIVYEDEKI